MFESIAEWGALLAVMTAVTMSLSFLLKTYQNKLTIVRNATNGFFKKSESLLKTANELPDSVLDALHLMNESISQSNSGKRLLLALKASGKHAGSRRKANGTLIDEVNQMRPELRELFAEASVAWFVSTVHRNLFYRFAIEREINKRRLRGSRYAEDQQTLAGKLVDRMTFPNGGLSA